MIKIMILKSNKKLIQNNKKIDSRNILRKCEWWSEQDKK